jgi:hypothetical protein
MALRADGGLFGSLAGHRAIERLLLIHEREQVN